MQILVKNSGRVAAKPSEVAGKASGDGLVPVQGGAGAAATEEGARARHAEPAPSTRPSSVCRRSPEGPRTHSLPVMCLCRWTRRASWSAACRPAPCQLCRGLAALQS